MHAFQGERTLMRIFIGEGDRCRAGAYEGKRLSDALVDLFRDRGFAGATVLRGVRGFGSSGRLRSVDLEALSLDLPIIVEVVETEEAIRAVLPRLDEMIDGGLVTLERARVVRGRAVGTAQRRAPPRRSSERGEGRVEMTHRFTGARTLMRIFIGETDRCDHGPYQGLALDHALLRLFRERDFAGVTVLRGAKGFGASAKVHEAHLLRLSLDLPEVIEVVETEEKIQEILPELDRMIDGGLVTLEQVRVILYRPRGVPEDERWKHRIEGLHADPGGGESSPPAPG